MVPLYLLRLHRLAGPPQTPQLNAEAEEQAIRAGHAGVDTSHASAWRRLRMAMSTAPTAPINSAGGQIKIAIRNAATWMP